MDAAVPPLPTTAAVVDFNESVRTAKISDGRQQNHDDGAGHALGQRNVGADKFAPVAGGRFFLVRHEFKFENRKRRRAPTAQVSFNCSVHGGSLRRNSVRRGG
jgi:hypothetical protein